MTTRKQRDAQERKLRSGGGKRATGRRAPASAKRTVKPGVQPQGYRFGPNPLDTTERQAIPPIKTEPRVVAGARAGGVRGNTVRSISPFSGGSTSSGSKSGIGGTEADGGLRKRK